MRLYGTSTGDGVIRVSPVQNYRKEVMTEEVHYHSKSKGEDIPVSEMSDLYVRRAFKKMIMKEKKRNDNKEALKVNIRNAMMYLEKALEE